MLHVGDRVTWWWIAENCDACPNNDHRDPDVDTHPMTDQTAEPLLSPCGHHRTLTGYPATVVSWQDAEDGTRYYQLDVDMPAHIGPGSKHSLVTRQSSATLATGRPRSGEFTPGDAAAELALHRRRKALAEAARKQA